MNQKGGKIVNVLLGIGFLFYSCFLLGVIMFKYVSPLELFDTTRAVSRTLNLIPFNDILQGYFNKLDLIGNVILFVPLGIYMKMYFEKSTIWGLIGRLASMSLTFEVLQFVFGIGASDITDILTNCLGGVIGLGIYWIIQCLFKTEVRIKWFVGICSSLAVVGVGSILINLMIYNGF